MTETAHELLEALRIIVANAVIGPDNTMGGTTDCYHVPIDDIEQARAAIARAIWAKRTNLGEENERLKREILELRNHIKTH